jgi:anti-sigma regulatory factor (Ser/Thr protein kinase)
MSIVEELRISCSLHHDAFVYDSDSVYVSILGPVLEEAIAAGDTVVAAVSARNAALLQPVVAADPTRVRFVEAESRYRNPVDAIVRYAAELARLPVGARALIIGEVQFGTRQAAWTSWTEYEVALNTVLSGFNVRVICPYDERVLPASVVDDARRTHPYLLTATDVRPSSDHLDAPALFARLSERDEIPTRDPDVAFLATRDEPGARRRFTDVAAGSGLTSARLGEITLGFSELLANAMVHGGGAARVRMWTTIDELVCVVDDDGPGCDDVLIGFTRPPAGAVGGYGTWLARRLFDRVAFARSATHGLTVITTTHC